MKKITTYNRAVQYLNKIFKLINTEYFDDTLDMPTITIQSTIGAYGHVTTSEVWETEQGNGSYELNIGADYLHRPIENIVATLIHESCHLYAMKNGIKDTSNRGIYHNRKFKELAEERGLIISKDSRYGWTITEPSEETYKFCCEWELQEMLISRNISVTDCENGTGKGNDDSQDIPVMKKGNSQKWICPCCKTIIRSTKKVNVVCGDCGVIFIRA